MPMYIEVSKPTAECPEPQLWKCFDPMSAEVEVLEFVSQLVKTIKPKLIVETGTYRGLAAFYIGRAIKETGRGKLITCELSKELHEKALQLITKSSLSDVVDCRLQSSLEIEVNEPIDLLFVDSEPTIRVQEIRRFWDKLAPNAIILCHDVNTGDHKPLREQILELDTKGEISVVFFPTPRGLAICQKREGRQ